MALDWDDLRFVHAVATEGSLAAAARALGVNHTTVLRRIAGLEARLGQRLFERRPDGYAPTPRVADLLGATAAIERSIRSLEEELAGGDLRLDGVVRVTCADSAAMLLLPPALVAFRAAHPGVTVEVAVANTVLDLAKREADIAVRQTAQPVETLVGRKVARMAFAWYGAPTWAGAASGAVPDAPLLLPDEASEAGIPGRWIRTTAPPEQEVAFRASSFLVLRDAARAGLGAAFLACYLGDSTTDLVRLSAPRFDPQCDLWVLTHDRIRRVPRIRAFMEVVAEVLHASRDLIEGERPVR